MESTSYWEEGAQPDFLLSVNDRMLQIRERLLEVADTRVPVVLCGEKGLGKEALARTLHRWSTRVAGPFVRVNCQTVPAAKLSGELFGPANGGEGEEVRGAEGAESSVDPFERARRGTLYLSGIETFDAGLRGRLASALIRLENESPDEAPRLVLSTESDSGVSGEAGGEPRPEGVRRDVLAGILGNGSALVVALPPLRARPEDIGLLAQHLLQLHSPFYSSRIKQVRSSLIDLFKQYSWPGNVRELERVIRRFLVLEDESAIRRELEEKMRQGKGNGETVASELSQGLKLHEIGRLAAQKAEARAIRRVLEQTRWNKKAAAQELGVSYKSLLNKVRDYRLDT